MFDGQWWFFLGCFLAAGALVQFYRALPMGWQVVVLFRYKHPEVLCECRTYVAAVLAAMFYELAHVLGDEVATDIWRKHAKE